MRFTRRWLFGLFGGAAAAQVLPKAEAKSLYARLPLDWQSATGRLSPEPVRSFMSFFNLAGERLGTVEAFPYGRATNGSLSIHGTLDIPPGTVVDALQIQCRRGDKVILEGPITPFDRGPEHFTSAGTMTGMVGVTLEGAEHEPRPAGEWEQVRDELGWDRAPEGWA